MTDNQGSSVGLQVTGMGHTYYIDDMKKSRTFLDRDLQYIVQEILPAETPGDFYQRADMAPTYKKRIPYSAQYNETTFEYLKRLATRYGQWFYWDGMRLQFGVIKASKVKLINGSSVHEFTTATQLVLQKVSLTGYDYTQNTRIQASQRKVEGGSSDGLAAHLSQKQHDYFTRDMEVSAYTAQAAGQPELEHMAQLQAAAAATSIVTYSGVSYEPLWLGRSFMVLKGPVEYRLVTVSVKHLSDNHGNYRCEFTAIPEDVATPPYTDPHCYAHAESQPAKVYDNNDPEGMGRIKVHFYWGTGGSKETDWIRMVQPHSGAGKGFYFIPEIGEEVLVGFEGGNAEKPYIIGAQYNGKQTSGFHTPGNDLKVIKTKSGHTILLDDSKDKMSITILDQSGNTIYLDTVKKSITIQAPETINIICKNLNIDVKENMKTNVGHNQENTIGKNIKTVAKEEISQDSGKKTNIASGDNTEIAAGKDLDLYGKKKLIGFTDGKTEFGAKEQMHVYGMTSLITAKDKIEYKAPSMNKLAESGKFKYDKEKQIINVKWMDAEMQDKIRSVSYGKKVSLLVQTRNYEEGETITLVVDEVDGKDVKDGVKELTLTGTVNAEGFAILKEEVAIEKSKREEEQKQALKKQEEEKKANETYTTYKGKNYTYKEWKIFEDEQHKIYLQKKNKKGFWG